MIQTKKRIAFIDIAKAMGIFIVLINHAELNLGVITFLGGMFYMPVFFVLSGYTCKEDKKEKVSDFIRNKAKRLLSPYVFFQLLIAGLFTLKNLYEKQSFIKALQPIWGAIYARKALYPNPKDVLVPVPESNVYLLTLNAPLWFFTALFLSLVLYKSILCLAKGNQKKEISYLSITILAGIVLKYFCPILLPWSLDTALISVAYLYAGRMLQRKGRFELLYKNPFGILLVIVCFVVTSFLNGSVNMSIRDFGRSVLLYIIVGSAATISVMLLSKFIEEKTVILSNILAWIGRHTIGILGLHLLVFAVVEYACSLLGMTNITMERIAKIILSVVILVPIDGLVQTYLPFVYGQKRRRK